MTINVIKGPAAIHVGRYWVGVATGNKWYSRRRQTSDAALDDARKLESMIIYRPTIEERVAVLEMKMEGMCHD